MPWPAIPGDVGSWINSYNDAVVPDARGGNACPKRQGAGCNTHQECKLKVRFVTCTSG